MRKTLFFLLTLSLACAPAYATFTFNHKIGATYDALLPNGQQAVHTETKIIYANPNDTLRMYHPDKATFRSYLRWYNYSTDRAILPMSRLEPAKNPNGSYNNDYAKNEYGWFKKLLPQNAKDKDYYEIMYHMHAGDSVVCVAADQSVYNDYTWASDTSSITEPTLSKRIIYEMHPATEIATLVDACTGSNYLETHEMIAPVGRQLYIGPDYRFVKMKIDNVNYKVYSHSNYYYNAASPICMETKANWVWKEDGVKRNLKSTEPVSAQFVGAYSMTAGKHTYTLQYVKGAGDTLNIAKFIVTYAETSVVGPATSLPLPASNLELISEETFNRTPLPTSTSRQYWNGHFNVDESTYGYYIKSLAESRYVAKPTKKYEAYWSEYGLSNGEDIYNSNNVEADGQMKWFRNHVEGETDDNVSNSLSGYMLFCDGSDQPGQVFNLQVSTSLCPGSKMYFSAWINDGSEPRKKNTNACAPNLDFIVIGIDELGGEHVLTTYTTGEFGYNAPARANADYHYSTNRLNYCEWNQIMFPVEFTASNTYPTYRLRITNKGKSSEGNDFAIDDIRIYVQKAPVMPIQATTSGECPEGNLDEVTAYLRVNYQAIDDNTNAYNRFYYQWRDYNNNPLITDYLNNAAASYGYIDVPTDEANILDGDKCDDLLTFDELYSNTLVPVAKYIKEMNGAEERYFLYIAQPIEVRTNFTYKGAFAYSVESLAEESECAAIASLMMAGGARIRIDGVERGDSVTDVCGDRSYVLDIVMTYVEQNATTGTLEEHFTPCRADWLIGDTLYIDNNLSVYKYNYHQIKAAIEDNRTGTPSATSIKILNHLSHAGLFIENKNAITIQPFAEEGYVAGYTAFPIPGSATAVEKVVCPNPRCLYINPEIKPTKMMVVGNSGESIPDFIAAQPRVIRVANSTKSSGFTIPLHHSTGTDDGVEYKVDSIILVSSTDPSSQSLEWKVGSNTALNLNANNNVSISNAGLSSLRSGYDYTFQIKFKDPADDCAHGNTYFTIRVIPDKVTWLGGPWNEDDSWSPHMPLAATNVVLQLNTDYNLTFTSFSPSSADSIYDLGYVRNQCNNIYIPYNSSLAGQEKIEIGGQAFIDVKEYAWKWTLTSIPIQGVITGDLFVNMEESSDPFVVNAIHQEVGEDADDRLTYQVYNKEFNPTTNKWKVASNSLTRPIMAGEAFMLGIDCESDDVNPIIRLPKPESTTEYRYYDTNLQNQWMQWSEVVTRDANYGKPVFDGNKEITLKSLYENVYVLGNPTFGYIDITKLVEDNTDKLTGKYYLEPAGATSIPKKEEMIAFNHDVANDENHVLLPPFRGILLEGKEASQTLIINIKSDVVNQQGRIPQRRYSDTGGDITTDVEQINVENGTRGPMAVYDISGRLIGNDVTNLPEGIYIIREGISTRKVLITK